MISLVRRATAPFGPVTATARGSRAWILVSKPAPKPVGVKTSVCESVVAQRPGIAGSSVGRAEPIADETVSEKVRRRRPAGDTSPPGAGFVTATAPAVRGNHVTGWAAPRVSHGRAAARTRSEPAALRRPSEIAELGRASVWRRAPARYLTTG